MVATRRMTITLALALLILLIANLADAKAGTRSDTAKRLNRGLAGTPMSGTGWTLEAEGWQAGIHPAFLAAIAAFEGGFDLREHTGKTPCLPFNPYGISSCGNAWTAPRFRSWRQSIRYAYRFLSERWPHADSVYDYHGFCTCGASYWGPKVAAKMRQLGFPPVVRYGRR